MKKVVIIHHFGGLGGAGKSLVNNVKLLSKKCDLTVVTPACPNDILFKLEKINRVEIKTVESVPSIPVYSGGFNLLSPRLYLHLIKSFMKFKSFMNMIQDLNADVIIVNSIIMSWVSLFFKGKKKVCFVRETQSKTVFNYLHRKLLNKFDLVCFISQFDASCWYLHTDIIVNENSVENEFVGSSCPEKPESDKVHFVYLGGTSYIKGFYHLCFSILQMKSRDRINVFVLGDCRAFGVRFAKLIFGDSLPFTFVGKVSNVSYYYERSESVIFPVVKVHQGRPIFEAGQHRRAAIVPDFANFEEFVQDMDNGILYKKKSSRALANVLSKACKREFDFNALGERNFRFFEEKHSLKSAKLRAESIIKKIIEI